MKNLFWHPVFGRLRRAWFGTAAPTGHPELHIGLMFWHPIFGRLRRAWLGTSIPTGRPAVFLGLINAAALPLGKMDGAFSLGSLNASGLDLGSIEAGPVRLGLVPVRRGS